MPYTITTKDGITLRNIPDEIDPNSDELKARVARIRSGEEGGTPTEPAAPAEEPGLLKKLGMALTDPEYAAQQEQARVASMESQTPRLMRGLQDPNFAIGQMADVALGAVPPLQSAVYGAHNIMRPILGGPELTPEHTFSDIAAEREKAISAERAAAGETGIDFTRMAGQMLSPVSLMAAGAAPASAAGRIALGGIEGALTPSAETDVAEYLKEKAGDVALGAGLGTAAEAVGKVARTVSPPIVRLGKRLFGSDVDEIAMGQLAKTMREEGLNPYDLMEQVQAGRRDLNKPLLPIDLVDPVKYPKSFQLMKEGVTGGTTSQPMVRLHQRGQPEEVSARLEHDIQRRISPRAAESYDATIANREARQTAWNAAFEPIKSTPVKSDRVMEILDKPTAKESIGRAIRAAEDDPDTNAAAQLFNRYLSLDPATGKLDWKEAPTVELIQDIKNLGYSRLLKDVYSGKPVSASTVDIVKQQRALMDEVDKAVPEYGKLRSRFADSVATDEARELGANFQSFLKRGVEGPGGKVRGWKSEEIINLYRGMSKPEQTAFRQGLANDMLTSVELAATRGGSRVTAPVGDPSDAFNAKLRQLQSIMGDTGRFRNFVDRLKAEKAIEKTSKRVGAFEKQASAFGSDELVDAALRSGAAAMSTSPVAKGYSLVSAIDRALRGRRPKLLEPVGQFATRAESAMDPLATRLLGAYDTASLPREPVAEPLYRFMFPSGMASGAHMLSQDETQEQRQGGLVKYADGGHVKRHVEQGYYAVPNMYADGGAVRRPSIPRELPGSIEEAIEEMARLRRLGIAGVKGFTGLGEAPSVMRPEELEAYGTGETAGLASDIADLIPGVGTAKALAGAGLGALKGGLGLAGMIRKGGDPSLFMTHSMGDEPFNAVNLLAENNPVLTAPSIAVSRDNPYPFTKGATLVMNPESRAFDPMRQALYPRDAYTFRRSDASDYLDEYRRNPRVDVRLTEGSNPSRAQRLAIELMPRFRSMEGYEKSPFGALNLGKFDEETRDASSEILSRYQEWVGDHPDVPYSKLTSTLMQEARAGNPNAQQIIRGSRMLPSEYGELKMLENLPITRENVSAILLPEYMQGEETFKEFGEQLGIPTGRAYDLATPSVRSTIDAKVTALEDRLRPHFAEVAAGTPALSSFKNVSPDIIDQLGSMPTFAMLRSPDTARGLLRGIMSEPMTMDVLKGLHAPLENRVNGGLVKDTRVPIGPLTRLSRNLGKRCGGRV